MVSVEFHNNGVYSQNPLLFLTKIRIELIKKLCLLEITVIIILIQKKKTIENGIFVHKNVSFNVLYLCIKWIGENVLIALNCCASNGHNKCIHHQTLNRIFYTNISAYFQISPVFFTQFFDLYIDNRHINIMIHKFHNKRLIFKLQVKWICLENSLENIKYSF